MSPSPGKRGGHAYLLFGHPHAPTATCVSSGINEPSLSLHYTDSFLWPCPAVTLTGKLRNLSF